MACLDCGGSECICRIQRELNEMRKRAEAAERERDQAQADCRALVILLRARVTDETWKILSLTKAAQEWDALNAELAELREDKARLEWILKEINDLYSNPLRDVLGVAEEGEIDREFIDASREEQAQ